MVYCGKHWLREAKLNRQATALTAQTGPQPAPPGDPQGEEVSPNSRPLLPSPCTDLPEEQGEGEGLALEEHPHLPPVGPTGQDRTG